MTDTVPTDEQTIEAVKELLRHAGKARTAADLVMEVRAIVGTILQPSPPLNPVHCVLCLNLTGERVEGPFVFDGYSLCESCQDDVLHRASHIWFDANDRFSAPATIERYRKARTGSV